MAYATVTDALEYYSTEYVNASFDKDDDGAISGDDLTRANRHLEAATSKINGHIIGRVDLPLATVPEDLVLMCIDIAIYTACPDALRGTEEKKERYDACCETLRAIAAGRYRLTVGSDSAPDEASEYQPTPVLEVNNSEEPSSIIQPGARELTRDKLAGLF